MFSQITQEVPKLVIFGVLGNLLVKKLALSA